VPYGATDDDGTDNALHDSALEREVQQLRDALAAMREDRDATRIDRDARRGRAAPLMAPLLVRLAGGGLSRSGDGWWAKPGWAPPPLSSGGDG
jgi:hypothetical protein